MRLLKKGQHETIKALIGLVLVAMLAFVIIKFVAGVVGSLSEDESATDRDFGFIVQEVSALLGDREKFSYTRLPVTLTEKYYIVAFDTGYQDADITAMVSELKTVQGTKTMDNIVTYRPTSCLNQACLCLFNEIPKTKEDRDSNVVRCVPFGHANFGDMYFSSLIAEKYSDEDEYNAGSYKPDMFTGVDQGVLADLPDSFDKQYYSYVFFCGSKTKLTPKPIIHNYANYADRYTTPWRVQNLYIEKVVAGSGSAKKTYIFLLPEGGKESDVINNRIDDISFAFKKDIQEKRDKIRFLADKEQKTEDEYKELYDSCTEFSDAGLGYTEGCNTIPECHFYQDSCAALKLPCMIEEDGKAKSLCWDDNGVVKDHYSDDGCLTADEYNQKSIQCPFRPY